MNTRIKSIAILLGTLLAGALLGGVIVGSVIQDRSEKLEGLRRPGGFVQHMQHVIQPADDEQWEAIRPIIEETARTNREIMKGAHRNLKSSFDSMLVRLEPLLQAEQAERLKAEHSRMKKRSKGKKKGRRGPPPSGPHGFPPSGPPSGE